MLDFFNRQTPLVKVLIGVVILGLVVILFWLTKKFIQKNFIIREPYEDIKIVVTSECDKGFYYNNSTSSANKCLACYVSPAQGIDSFGNYGAVGGMSGDFTKCSSCDSNQGYRINATDGTKVNSKGINCLLCNESVPDPDTTLLNTACSSGLSLRDTTTVTNQIGSWSLVATSTKSQSGISPAINYAITLSSTTTDSYSTGTVNKNTYETKGIRTTTINVLGINVIYQAGQVNTNLNTLFTNSFTDTTNTAKSKNFIKFLVNNCPNSLRTLLSKVLFSGFLFTNTTPSPLVDLTRLSFRDNTGASYTLSTLEDGQGNSLIPAGRYISQLVITTDWSCGTPTVFSTPCQNVGTTAAPDYQQSKSVSYTYFGDTANNLPNVNDFGNRCPSTVYNNVSCLPGQVDCSVSNLNNPIITNGKPVYVSSGTTSGQYMYTDTYVYNISTLPDGGTPCQNLTYTVAGTNLNPLPVEMVVDNNSKTVTITRTCTVDFSKSTLESATPSANPGLIYNNNPDLNGKFSIYKTAGSVVGTSNNLNSACAYQSALLPVITIDPLTYNPTDSYDSTSGVNTRRTILNATRNNFETIDTTDKTSSNSLYVLLSGLMSSMGIVSSPSLITSIMFAPKDYPTDKSTPTSTVNSNTSLSAPTVSTLLSSNIFETNSTIISQSNPCNTIISLGGASKGLLVSFNKTNNGVSNYGGRAYRLSSSGVYSMISNNTYTDINTSRPWSYCSIDRVNSNIQTAVCYGDVIYRSYDGGVSFFGTNSTSNLSTIAPSIFSENTFSNVCMSQDGSIQYAVTSPGFLYYSINSGVTWTKYAPTPATYPQSTPPNVNQLLSTPQYWSGVDCSGDGTRITLVCGSSISLVAGYIVTGQVILGASSSFNCPYPTPGLSLPTGTFLSLVQRASASFTFTIPGSSIVTAPTDQSLPAFWTYQANGGSNTKVWKSISMSFDGKYQTAVVDKSGLYISSDFGVNWTNNPTQVVVGGLDTGATRRNWADVKIFKFNDTAAPSNIGKYQVAIEYTPTSLSAGSSSGIYYSNNYGANWIPVRESPSVIFTGNNTWVNVDIDINNRKAYITHTSGYVFNFTIPA